MKRLLLDTSVVIDFLRRADKRQTLLYKLSTEHCAISLITHTELLAGKSVWESKKAREELETLFSGLTILPFDAAISEKAGAIKAVHASVDLLDCIIAATAICHDLELVTFNTKDFSRIANIKLYSST